jgi:hypothetical protein
VRDARVHFLQLSGPLPNALHHNPTSEKFSRSRARAYLTSAAVGLDGIYDPSQYNDRLLLGLKGTMSEAELHVLLISAQTSKPQSPAA